MTDVKEIIPSENKIITEDATFHYDKLVIATGCKTNFLATKKDGELSLWNEKYTRSHLYQKSYFTHF